MLNRITIALIAVLFAFPFIIIPAHAEGEQEKIVTLEGQIIDLAKQRHAVEGDNLRIRGEMLELKKGATEPQRSAEFKQKMGEFHAALKVNRQKQIDFSKQIVEKRRRLQAVFHQIRQRHHARHNAKKGEKKDEKKDAPELEDVTNLDQK